MSGSRKKGGKKKRKVFRRLAILAGLAGIGYMVASRQRPGPCAPAGGPEERVIVRDEEELGGLGTLMQMMIPQLLERPEKLEILDRLNLVVAIEPVEAPETAVTLTFSDGYVVIESGVAPNSDVKICCELEVLMQMSGMGQGLDAVKYLTTPEGKALARKALSGELKIEGLLAHPLGLMQFSKFLAITPDME